MAKVMGLKESINYFQEYLTNKQISNLLGVTLDQVYKYGTGHTKTCSDKVVDAFYDNFVVQGEKVLIDFFPSEEEYLNLRDMRTSSASQSSLI